VLPVRLLEQRAPRLGLRGLLGALLVLRGPD
jgi:hypothetical protein